MRKIEEIYEEQIAAEDQYSPIDELTIKRLSGGEITVYKYSDGRLQIEVFKQGANYAESFIQISSKDAAQLKKFL